MSASDFQPYRNDHVIQFLFQKVSRSPMVLATVYSLISVGGTLAIAYLMDLFFPSPTGLIEHILEDYANLINMGVVLPIGFVLVIKFYRQVEHGFNQLVQDKILRFADAVDAAKYLEKVDRAINRPYIFPIAIAVSVIINAIILVFQQETWHSWNAGPQAWWFRFFVFLNFYMIINILLRGVLTVREIRKVFDTSDGKSVVLQPLHPDGCGGLKELGAISMALNTFLCLLAIYISILAFAKGANQLASPSDYPLFAPMVVGFIALSIYLFMAPLTKAHTIMSTEKDRILSALNSDFQQTYSKISTSISTDGIQLEDAQKIESIERLYRIASNMPVWPMDAKILRQLTVSIAMPLLLSLVSEILSKTAQSI